LRDLRAGEYDVLVGINLLREGLDLPEVSLVAILDADKEGFLRSPRSLIQTIGRAARNSNGQVFMYADRITDAMKYAMSETDRRRAIQIAYNAKHGITPATVRRAIFDINPATGEGDYYAVPKMNAKLLAVAEPNDPEVLEALRQQMFAAAESLDFEKAARLRDEINRLGGEAGAKAAPAPKRKSRSPAAKSKRR
jgi:excinuclease ABC subunit B